MRITAIVVAASLALGSVALAQTTTTPPVTTGPTLASTVISVNDLLAPWITILFTAFMGVVLALLGWIKSEITRRTGVTVENAYMQVLQKAIENAAGSVLTKVSAKAKNITIDTKSEAIRNGVEYVNQAAAEAVASFGLTQEQIAEKIIAKLGVITASNPDVNVKDTTPPPPNTGSGG